MQKSCRKPGEQQRKRQRGELLKVRQWARMILKTTRMWKRYTVPRMQHLQMKISQRLPGLKRKARSWIKTQEHGY